MKLRILYKDGRERRRWNGRKRSRLVRGREVRGHSTVITRRQAGWEWAGDKARDMEEMVTDFILYRWWFQLLSLKFMDYVVVYSDVIFSSFITCRHNLHIQRLT